MGYLNEKMFTIPEAAKLARCSSATMRRRILDGIIPAVRPAGTYLIRGPDLEKYIRSTSTKKAPQKPASQSEALNNLQE